MSLTGKGHLSFDDGLDDPASIAPRRGVIDFGDDEAPAARNDASRRSEQDCRSERKSRFVDQNASTLAMLESRLGTK